MTDASAQPTRVVSVIVPHYNDPRLPQCLDALEALDEPPGWRVEVVLVDNGSMAPPRELVEARTGVTYLEHPGGGSYAARNAGLEVATGEVVAFTDSDCRPASDWLVAAVRRLEQDPGLAAVAGRVRTAFDTPRPTSPVGWWDALEAFPQERYAAEGFGVTANLVVRRTAGEAVGWFDAEAMSGGDRAFGERLTGAGHRLEYAPDAVVAHPARTTWSELLTKGLRTAKGQARMDALQGAGVRDFVRSIYWFGMGVRRVVRRTVKDPELPDLRARVQYLFVGLVYRVFWFVQRSRWRLHYRAHPPVQTLRAAAAVEGGA